MFCVDAQRAAVSNESYRRVLFTTDTLQLVVMKLEANQTIDKEKHVTAAQLIRVEHGSCYVTLYDTDGEGKKTVFLTRNGLVIITPDQYHRVDAGPKGAHLSTVYGPPQHPAQLNQVIK